MSPREWVLTPGREPCPVAETGGKAHQLARLWELAGSPALQASRARVPRFVVIAATAFDRFVVSDEPWPPDEAAAERRRAAVMALGIPPNLRSELLEALAEQRLLGAPVAVRSSAVSEDGAQASFAGQFETVLGVPAEDTTGFWDAVRAVWSSAFLPRAAAYRAERARSAETIRMAVVIQEMVESEASGVAFSADPVSGDRETVVVSAVHGLGEGLVSGELDADTYRVCRAAGGGERVVMEVAHKDRALRSSSTGPPRMEPVPEALRDLPVLSDEEARRVAACARSVADAVGTPQDIEWALIGAGSGPRELILLQTRPITTLPSAAEPGQRRDRRVWDNSNIVESYAGVTTPLTFTFARRVYEDVYRQFCRLMGVSEPMLEAHSAVFANMLGLVRGRVYYNLLNWYRIIALLPGFEFNRSFMERMMGVREALEDPPAPPSAGNRLRDLARLIRMIARMIRESRRLPREVPAFHARVSTVLAALTRQDWSRWNEARLVAAYHGLEHDLLRHWRAPLVNDFFAMIHFGVLGRLIEKWLPGSPATLANDLLCGEGGIISTEPAREVMALARRVASDPAMSGRFAQATDATALLDALRRDPASADLARAIDAYIERFGDRCLEELKLETITLREDPSFLVHMIRSYVASGTVDPEVQQERETAIRREAERVALARLSGVRRALFTWVLGNARRRVRDRENLRFERTRVFGVVRRLFLAVGERLAAAGRIESPRDVFFLTIEDLFVIGEERGAALDPAGLVRRRREEFAGYQRDPAPPDRFETWGPPPIVYGAEGVAASAAGAAPRGTLDARELLGTGCCPGVVRERVRIVRDPREADGVAGRILVAERTDPGWTLLFPAARGLLVQRGSLLSHSAIVAREMGLPCVVGIAGLLDTLRDGEEVEMDGATGRVVRLESPAGAA